MNVLAVIAHDRKKSLNRFLFESIIKHLTQQGHSVDILDLYQRQNDIPFYVQPTEGSSITGKTLSDFPFFQEHKNRFMAADTLVIVAPVYWYSSPGILKSWFDLITNFAWKYETPHSLNAKALHHIKRALVVTTMAMPWFFKVFLTRNTIKNHYKSIFNFIDIKNYTIYEITNVTNISPKKVSSHLNKILKLL